MVLGLDRGGASAVQTPLALVAALKEPRERGYVVEWIIDVVGFGDLGAADLEVGVGADAGLQLLRLHGEEVLLRSEQGRILRQRQINGLLHGERKRRSRSWRGRQVLGEDVRRGPGKQQAREEVASDDLSAGFSVVHRRFQMVLVRFRLSSIVRYSPFSTSVSGIGSTSLGRAIQT